MVKKQKLWAHYERIKLIAGLYITLFLTIPIFSMGLSCLAHSKQIDAGVAGAIKLALLIGLKWYAIIFSVLTVLFIIWFLCSSDTVEFTDDSILYYSWIFSKKANITKLNEISECVLSGRLWRSKREKSHKRKIVLFNKSIILCTFDIYSKLALMLVLHLGETKFKLVSDKGNLKTISKFYDIDFMSLAYDKQLTILNYYCKLNYKKYKTGEEILSKKQKNSKSNKAK